MTTALDILIEGRRRIEDPDRWGKGQRADRDDPSTCCAIEAIQDGFSCLDDGFTVAICALKNAAGLADFNSIPVWNDAPDRVHPEVLAVYDKAIATLRAKG